MTTGAKTQEASPVFRETGTGMELELVWSGDETMARLYITIPSQGHGPAKTHTMRLSSFQLNELRNFLTDNIE